MTEQLPLNEEPIFVEWLTRPGGVRVSAWTDKKGNAYLGVFVLNRMGKPNGLPCWFKRDTFQSDIIIGFEDNDDPIIVGLDTWATERGLHMVVYLPSDWFHPTGVQRNIFAPWGSEPPSLGFIIKPTDDTTKT